MSQGSAGEKTEKPTAKRLKDSRKEGQIARTNDLGGWLMVLAATWIMPAILGWSFSQIQVILDTGAALSRAGTGGGTDDLMGFFGDAVTRGLLLMAPMVLVAMVLGVGAQVAQIGFAPKPLKPDFKKLNVPKGIKGIFGKRLLWETAKNILKLGVIVGVAWGPITHIYTVLVAANATMTVPLVAQAIAEEVVSFLRNAAVLGLVLAIADYAQSKKQTDSQIKMSKQEVKEEHKQSDGDPQVKGQIRQRQMAMSRNRMMAAVPDADVVVVNPTHIAIALKYDPTVGAPKVLAKGAGAVADRIRELAGESDVPIVRDVPLARTVYRLVEVDQQIPVDLYEAVARVLAFVFTLRSRGRATGFHTSPFESAHADLVDLEKQHRRRQPATAS